MQKTGQGVNKSKLAAMLLLICIVVAAATWWILTHDFSEGEQVAIDREMTPEDAFIEPELPPRVWENDIVLPVGLLLITEARATYESGTLRLVVPRLDLDSAVGDNTLMEDLEQGPGLYKFSQMPEIYNTNVSIAAHRDLAGCEFYELDKMTQGDFIYLIYNQTVFQYAYRSTEIIEPNNWDVIRSTPDCRVTLTTCDPIGTSLRRMVVVGELVAWEEYSPVYSFV